MTPSTEVLSDRESEILEATPTMLGEQVRQGFQGIVSSSLYLAETLYYIREHELWRKGDFNSYHDFITNGAGIAEKVAKSTCHALPRAFAVALEFETDDRSVEDIWNHYGWSKLTAMASADQEIRAMLAEMADGGATRNAIVEAARGSVEIEDPEPSDIDVGAPSSSPDVGDPDVREVSSIVMKEVVEHPIRVHIQDLATGDSLRGAPIERLSEAFFEYHPRGCQWKLQARMNVNDGNRIDMAEVKWVRA